MNDKLIRALNNQALRDGPSKLMSDAAHEIYSLSLEVEYYQHLTELLREQTNEAYEFVRDGLCNDGLSKLLQVMDVLKSERPNKLDHRLDASDACGQSGGSKGSA